MKVIIDNSGVRSHTVNDKAQISHGIEQKTELSKKLGGTLETQMKRTVHVDTPAKANDPRGSPSVSARKAEQYSKQATHNNSVSVSDVGRPETRQSAQTHKTDIVHDKGTAAANEISKDVRGPAAARSVEYYSNNTPHSTAQTSHTAEIPKGTDKRTELPRRGGIETRSTRTVGSIDRPVAQSKRNLSPEALARRQKKFKDKRLKLAPMKKYKVLENGVVNTGEITKRKARTIYSQVPLNLQNAKPKMIQPQTVILSRSQSERVKEMVEIGKKRDYYAKKPKMPQIATKQSEALCVNSKVPKLDKQQGELLTMAMGGFIPASNRPRISKALTGTKKAFDIAKKPVDTLKSGFYSQAEKSDDNGVKSIKLGMQTAEYGTRGVKTVTQTGVKTVKTGSKISKKVYHKLHKTTTAELRRSIKKQVFRNKIRTQVDYAAKQAVKKGAKAVEKAAEKGAKKAAESAYKAAQAAAKAVASAVTRVASLIVETMPWSLIIIGVILIVVLIALMFGSMLSGVGGSVAGGGSWLVDDETSQTPEEIYEGYKQFIEQAQDVMENQAKKALENKVTGFCNSDTADPRKIIEYHDKSNSRLFYPAYGADATINALIEQFGTEDYADYMSLLFVLMTREKQQADGVTDAEIYDFDFTKEDFEEFMKTVNENSCRWGDTFVIKTAVETSGNACPGENCKRKTISGCHCGSTTDSEGHVHYYCKGHPYCPHNHTKMTVNLYTVKDYYGKDYPEIYNFTDNEIIRYEASKAIIQAMLDYWEEQE